MKTNSQNQQIGNEGAQLQSEQVLNNQVWDVLLNGKVIGSVHGKTEAEARGIVAPFKLNLQITPHNPANW